MTPQQLHIARRWHHDLDGVAGTKLLQVPASHLRAILAALWTATDELVRRDRQREQADRARRNTAIRRAENNLHIFGPDCADN